MCKIGRIDRLTITLEFDRDKINSIGIFFSMVKLNLLGGGWQTEPDPEQSAKRVLRIKIIRNPKPKGTKYHNDKFSDKDLFLDYDQKKLIALRLKLEKLEQDIIKTIKTDEDYKRVSFKAEIINEIIEKVKK